MLPLGLQFPHEFGTFKLHHVESRLYRTALADIRRIDMPAVVDRRMKHYLSLSSLASLQLRGEMYRVNQLSLNG